MSRIGRKPIQIPEGVQIELNHRLKVIGKLGELSISLPRKIRVERKEDFLFVIPKSEERQAKALQGLTRSLIVNMIQGVSNGFKKTLELSGIGFRASLSGEKLILSLGFSHPIEINPPPGIKFSVAENKIVVSGINKELVGQVAANIRAIRPPDPYKGKGIRYEGEQIRLKPSKAAKVGPGVGG